MGKPELSPWHDWKTPGVFRHIRTEAEDSESVACVLRRKCRSEPGAPVEYWWKATVYTPDDSENYLGYFDTLDEAKAAADKSWGEWELESDDTFTGIDRLRAIARWVEHQDESLWAPEYRDHPSLEQIQELYDLCLKHDVDDVMDLTVEYHASCDLIIWLQQRPPHSQDITP